MRQSTIDTIEAVVKSDAETSQDAAREIMRAILRACRAPIAAQRKKIPAQRAMEILDVSRPTLTEYVKRGKLHCVKTSPRKTRFFLDEVEELANTPEVL